MNTKEILTEWNNFINNNLLLEISRNEVIEVIGEDNYNILVKSNRKASQDQNFLQVIINTYSSDQNHSIEDILGLYQNYTRFIAPRWNRGEEATIDVPGGHRSSLTPDSTTYDDMLKFIDASSSMILKSKVYIKCLKQGPVNPDFELIINDSDWIICYPKTIKGSISLARSFWNGSELEYDKSVSGGVGRMIGEMSWCTSIVSGGNMFLNYHRKMNLHMYYCIKKNTNVEEPDRKLCISFSKKYGEVNLMEGQSSVDGNNHETSEKEFRSYIGERFDSLFRDTEKSERLEIDEKAYYESISLEQYKILRDANEDNLDDFAEELRGLLEYSRDRKKILLLAAKEDNIEIKIVLAEVGNFIEADPTGEIIKKLAQDKDKEVSRVIAWRKDLLEVDPSGELIRLLLKSNDTFIAEPICRNYDFSKIDPSGKLIRQLYNKDKYTRQNIIGYQNLLQIDPSGKLINKLLQIYDYKVDIARNKNLLKMDPSGKLFMRLARDEDPNIRKEIADRKDLLEVDPSGELIRQLTTDESSSVRGYIAGNKNLLKLDPSGEIIKKLSNDDSWLVRRNTALREDLLEVDPSGEIIRKLAQDPNDSIRFAINRTYDLSKLSSNTNESLLRSYIKFLL